MKLNYHHSARKPGKACRSDLDLGTGLERRRKNKKKFRSQKIYSISKGDE
jgi:hypothetical protein